MAYAGSSSPFASATGPNVLKSTTANESTKRPRDDADNDDNPREQKRPSPPPDQEKAAEETRSPATASGSSGGFLGFASTSSPFANVKGPNLFSKKTSGTASPWSGSQSPTIVSPKPTGFEAFASPSSPFARSRSPVGALGRSRSPSSRKSPSAGVNKNSNAFSAYATQGFSLRSAAGKRARADDGAEDGKRKRNSIDGPARSDEDTEGSEEREKMSFGDRLRAETDGQGSGDDEDAKVVLTEQERESCVVLRFFLLSARSAYWGRRRRDYIPSPRKVVRAERSEPVAREGDRDYQAQSEEIGRDRGTTL